MKYFLIAGEASGDLHASNLMAEIRKKDHKAQFCFLGGDLMSAVGGELVMHYREMAFMGFFTILWNIRKVLRNFSVAERALLRFQPDVVILIDYPGFNLRMAKFVKNHLQVPVVYYIPPKLWAWKSERIKQIKKYIDRVYTIFPFESSFYAKFQYEVEYVGNPTVDSVSNRPFQKQSFEAFCTKNNLFPRPVIALLAGSRKQEIVGCLPRMIDAALRFPDYQIVVAGAPGIEPAFYEPLLKATKCSLVFGQTYELVSHAAAAVVNSGTATLETALLGTPQVVVYHIPLGWLGNVIKDSFVKVPFISLVNLIAERELVKELMAHHFTVDKLEVELKQILLSQEQREFILQGYEQLESELGEPGTARNAASKIISLLK